MKVIHETTPPRYILEEERPGLGWTPSRGYNSHEDAIEAANDWQSVNLDRKYRVVDTEAPDE